MRLNETVFQILYKKCKTLCASKEEDITWNSWMRTSFVYTDSATVRWRCLSLHVLSSLLQEIPENGADVAHLVQVHQPFIAAGINLTAMWNKYLSFGKHHWTAQWTQMMKPDEHIGSLKLTHDLTLFGISLPFVFLNVHAMQVIINVNFLLFYTSFSSSVG